MAVASLGLGAEVGAVAVQPASSAATAASESAATERFMSLTLSGPSVGRAIALRAASWEFSEAPAAPSVNDIS
ncbi:hypothetical protein GCM10009862_26560 [Microbacterium binotii]|uniref:Uncharacterized protein n=1 Tax=Microbacterium binotii TaxID=462710 RepID=A0ABN3PHP1_9MICO